ncbi:MAG: cyclic nucleotide-binding domain-containing protein [Deltaproteobacteria bacterium]|nr:cyclic nucleotide-binding domain-containing protein [Deltaproteobacteria bacterium]
MDANTTASLLEKAASPDQDLTTALAFAGEALRLSPEDDRARTEVGVLLGKLGEARALDVLLVSAERFGRRGFALPAIAACRDALELSSGDGARVEKILSRLHERIGGRVTAARAHVPPPLVPQPVREDDPESLMKIEDARELIRRATDLALGATTLVTEAVAPPVPLFSEIERSAFVPLVRAMTHRRVSPGEVIVREGEPGASLFVVVHGDLRVTRDRGDEPQLLARLGGGSLFGEMALLTDQPRTASVVAETACELFEIGRDHVEKVVAAHPAFGQELIDFAKRRMLRNVLETSPLFRPLEERERLETLRSFSARVVPESTTLIIEGSIPTGLFVVAAGEVRITKIDPGGDPLVMAELHDGDVFGEISLLEDGLTTATATATRKTVVLYLARERFLQIIAQHPAMKAYLATLSRDRLRELKSAEEQAGEALDADELIIV